MYTREPFLKRLFDWERISVTSWCSNICCMGRWAEFFDIMMILYVLEHPFIVVSNNTHGFNVNDIRQHLDYVMRMHYNRLIRANELANVQTFLNHTMQVQQNLSRNEMIYFTAILVATHWLEFQNLIILDT